jgi:hypothetical protein
VNVPDDFFELAWLRRYWQVFPEDPRRRWCLRCGEWFVGRDDCPICLHKLVVEEPERADDTLVRNNPVRTRT